ncbi:hypothetical protein GCM10023347_27650 [Streptomyces chumphonensis]
MGLIRHIEHSGHSGSVLARPLGPLGEGTVSGHYTAAGGGRTIASPPEWPSHHAAITYKDLTHTTCSRSRYAESDAQLVNRSPSSFHVSSEISFHPVTSNTRRAAN